MPELQVMATNPGSPSKGLSPSVSASKSLPATSDRLAASVEAERSSSLASAMHFAGHQAYIVSVAKMCRDMEVFTDVKILCADGELAAHRLVLASCSSFLGEVFLTLPQGLPEFTLIMPNIRKHVVATLLDFLYTGKMKIAQESTRDLQQLVHILQIDPDNVRVESIDDSKQTRLTQTKITSMMKVRPSTYSSPASKASPANVVVETKAKPLRAAKRRSSQEVSENLKEVKLTPLSITSTTPGRGRGGLRRRGRPRSSGLTRQGHNISDSSTPSGFHDMTNVTTWVCALCKKYDPVLPPNVDPNIAANTEWVGCDCNRWYHQYCTKLDKVTDSFNCSLVKLKCLPPEDN